MGGEYNARARQIEPDLLGRRIKEARLAARLTQTALGGSDASKAYVSRIEDGQRRPSIDLLTIFSERLGVPLESLLAEDREASVPILEARVRLDHAELQLATGDAPAALVATTALLEDLRSDWSTPDLLREVRVAHAGALEATGDLVGAIALLEELVRTVVPDQTWLRCSIALSRCYRETGDLARSIEVGEAAIRRVDELGLAGLTEAIQLTVTVAGGYVVRGELTTALRLCEDAIEAAERYDSPVGMASAYWNASLIETRRGAPAAALTLAKRALVTFEAAEDARNLARLRAQIANIQLMIDPPDAEGALVTLDQVQTDMRLSATNPLDSAGAQLTRARALHVLGRDDEALAELDAAEAQASGAAPLLHPSIAVLRGRIALARGDAGRGREYFQNAVQRLTGVGSDLDAARLWFDLGDLLSEVDQPRDAADAYRRAAASAGVLGSQIRRLRTLR